MKLFHLMLLLHVVTSRAMQQSQEPSHTFVDDQGRTHSVIGSGDSAREYVSRNGRALYAVLPLPSGRRVTFDMTPSQPTQSIPACAKG